MTEPPPGLTINLFEKAISDESPSHACHHARSRCGRPFRPVRRTLYSRNPDSGFDELTAQYAQAAADPAFQAELNDLYKNYVGRPSPLYFARRLTEHCGGARIYLKREDLNHTGAHKINNTLGQALLAAADGQAAGHRRDGRRTTWRGHGHGLRHFGLQCVVYMGEEDIRRQRPNVFSMKLLGAEVRPVTSGSRTLRDAVNEAFRDWMSSVESTHYCLGSVVGPHPFPQIVRDFQSIIGRETRAQSLEQFGRLPNVIVACVGGGSNAAGMFYPFIEDAEVELVGVEAGGRSERPGDHAATLSFGRPGVLHGAFSYVLQDDDGQTSDVHSVNAGLDYPAPVPSTVIGKTAAAYVTRSRATTKSCRHLMPWPGWKAFCPPWKARTPCAGPWRLPPRGRPTRWLSYVSPAAATRMPPRLRGCEDWSSSVNDDIRMTELTKAIVRHFDFVISLRHSSFLIPHSSFNSSHHAPYPPHHPRPA